MNHPLSLSGFLPVNLRSIALALLLSTVSSFADEIYFAPTTVSAVLGASALPPSSFVTLSSSVASEPSTSGSIRLVNASISPTLASPAGYVSFQSDALLAGKKEIEGAGVTPTRTAGAAEYRYGLGQNGGVNLWNIQFSGVPAYQAAQQNFVETKLQTALNGARAAIRANPYFTGEASGYALLFQARYEAIVPYTYAGNEWRAVSDKNRVNAALGKTINDRIADLTTARDRYRTACIPFLEMLAHPAESAWLWDAPFYVGSAAPTTWAADGQTWTSLLLDAYVQAVGSLAECQAELLNTQYLRDWQPPGAAFNADALVASITAAADEIERLVLPLGVLAARTGMATLDTGTPLANAARLRRLGDQVRKRALVFSPGINEIEQNRWSFRTYGPDDVPFLTQSELGASSFSFNNFVQIAAGTTTVFLDASPGSLIYSSKTADAEALTVIDAVINTQQQVSDVKEETRSTYQTQLTQLCGARLSDPNNIFSELIPDVLGYLAPPEDRDPLLLGESLGAIAEQWNRIDQAETRVAEAYRALAETDEEAAVIRQFGDERKLSYDRIAKIQLDTGESISALEYLSGEVRAKAIEDEAEARAKAAKKRSWFGALAKGAFKAVSGDLPGAWNALKSSAGGIADQVKSANDQAGLSREIGRIQADSTRALTDIQQQQTVIRAKEAAQITLEQAEQEETRIKEQLHKLMIGVERKKLEILLAKQQLDSAELEHANMIGRIAYLLQEYRRVMIRQANSTLNRPDIRLRRDYKIREADRKFRFAQEFSYLCAKAAEYRFLTLTSHDRVKQELINILRAQNGEDLEAAVAELNQIRKDFLGAVGGRAQTRQVRFSLRDYLVQNNDLEGYLAANGSWLNGVPPPNAQYLHFPASIKPGGGTIPELSDEQFKQFLRRPDILQTNPATGFRLLRIPFATGYEPDFGGRSNPLYFRGEYGHLIEGAGAVDSSPLAVGVFINVRNSRSVLVQTQTVTAFLEQQGVSYIPYQRIPFATDPVKFVSARVWNLPARTASVPVVWNTNTTLLNGQWSQIPGVMGGAAQLNERSPANQRWVLVIAASETFWDQMLDSIRDIDICMTVRGWTGQGLPDPLP